MQRYKLQVNSHPCENEKKLTFLSSVPVVEDERYHFDAADLDHVQRKLKQRHVQM